MAVFPESKNKLDVNDVPGSLGKLENYIRYMTERVEFSTRNMTRNVSEAGVSSVEILLLMQEMAGTVATLGSAVNGMTGSINAIGSRLDEMQGDQAGMAGDIASLTNRVTEMQAKQNEMDTKITGLQEQVTDLAERVAGLEATE